MTTANTVIDDMNVFTEAAALTMREAVLPDYDFLPDALKAVRTWVALGVPDLRELMPRSTAELAIALAAWLRADLMGGREDQDPMRALEESALGAYEKVQKLGDLIDTIKDSTATLTLKISSDTSGLAPIFQEILKYSSVAQLLESAGSKNGGTVPGNNTRTAATTRGQKR